MKAGANTATLKAGARKCACIICKHNLDKPTCELPICNWCNKYGSRVYVAICGDLIKVGSTKNLRSRFSLIKNHEQKDITLIAFQTFESRMVAYRREHEAHKLLRAHRAPKWREWYYPSGAIFAELSMIFKDGNTYFDLPECKTLGRRP